jgi:hypothetical protein
MLSSILYRSLKGPAVTNDNFDMIMTSNVEEILGPEDIHEGLTWTVTQPGGYIICYLMELHHYFDPEGEPGFDYCTVALSGGKVESIRVNLITAGLNEDITVDLTGRQIGGTKVKHS